MAKVTNIFADGKMNSDLTYSLTENKGYVRAENLRIIGAGEDGRFNFLKGSKLVSTIDNEGMVVIGMYEGIDNKMYYFLTNEYGRSKIVSYDVETQEERVIIDDRNNILRFDIIRWDKGKLIYPLKYLLSINQIGDLLFFSNEKWEYPRVINVNRDYSQFVEKDIILAKEPPIYEPLVILRREESTIYDVKKDSFVSFAYRYKYLDGDYSPLSFYSDVAFESLYNSDRVNDEDGNGLMENYFNIAIITLEIGGDNVTEVEVFAREHGSNTAYIIHRESRDSIKKRIGDSTAFDIEYKFSKNYEVLDEESTNMIYSNIPKYPKSQISVGNRMFYANYKEGYDIDVDVDYEVKLESYDFNLEYSNKTAISLFKYRVGIVFYNDYNEATSVLLPADRSKSEVFIPFGNRKKINKIVATLKSPFPKWATKMKWVVLSEDLNYENIVISTSVRGEGKGIPLTKWNMNKIKEGDILIKVREGDKEINYSEVVVKKIATAKEDETNKDVVAYAYINNEKSYKDTSKSVGYKPRGANGGWDNPQNRTGSDLDPRNRGDEHREGAVITKQDIIIYRTKNKSVLSTAYFETTNTYLIRNGELSSREIGGTSFRKNERGEYVFNIGFYNGYSWGDGTESYKIKDEFNAKSLRNKMRPNLHDRNGYRRIHRKFDITYSGLYNYDLKINQLSTFNPTTANWFNLPIQYGEIQRMVGLDGNITAFLNNRVVDVMYGKSIIADLQGNESVGLSKEVLGGYRILPYEYGISNNPESIAVDGQMIFFTDRNRARILVKAGNDIEVLNGNGSGFRREGVDFLNEYHSFLGSYDDANGEYVITATKIHNGILDSLSLAFSMASKGFTSYYTYHSDYNFSMNGKYFSSYKGKIYQNEVTEDYNNFVGQGNKVAKIVFVVNPQFSTDNVYKAVYLQSNKAWDTSMKTNLTATQFLGDIYQKRESYYYTDIQRDNSTPLGLIGIGIIKNIVGNELIFDGFIDNQVCIGGVLINEDDDKRAIIKGISDNKVIVEDGSIFAIGEFICSEKPQVGMFRPNGVPMRGEWMEVTLTTSFEGNDREMPYMTAVNTEVIPSKL